VALHGFEFLGDDDYELFKAGYFGNKLAKTREIKLEVGERVLGVYSRIEKRYGSQAIHRDFQFIIGKKI
jgi:hypothetical protein